MLWRSAAVLALAICGTGCAREHASKTDARSTRLRPSQAHLRAAQELAAELSVLLPGGFDSDALLLSEAPRFASSLAFGCPPKACESLQLRPLYPAGKGLVLAPQVEGAKGTHEYGPVFLRPLGSSWELLDELPPEIEAGPRQIAIEGSIEVHPDDSKIDVQAVIELLSADEPYLLFDFFAEGEAEIEGLRIEQEGRALRFLRHENLLVVELPEGTRQAHLRFRYSARLPSLSPGASELILYESWMPYLGGTASWELEVGVPLDFVLGTPSIEGRPDGLDRKHYRVRADALDRYPLVMARGDYDIESFEHLGTHFEVWLRPQHKDRQAAIEDAVVRSMNAFERIGAFPSAHYRILEASYAAGHGAFGLRNLMVLGQELLEEEHLLPAVAHELAHAWFAGQLRDPQGRWSEGLASYVSQWPLSRERARKMRWGWTVAYEQVPGHRDYPLQDASPAPSDPDLASAILYGKAALVLQELEVRIGIQKLRQVLSLFVLQYRGRDVRWREFQQALADVMGDAEARRFGRWLETAGAPDWRFDELALADGLLSGIVQQAAPFPFVGTLEIASMSEQSEIMSTTQVPISGARSAFQIEVPRAASWVLVDPNYTLPRQGDADGKPRWMQRIRELPRSR